MDSQNPTKIDSALILPQSLFRFTESRRKNSDNFVRFKTRWEGSARVRSNQLYVISCADGHSFNDRTMVFIYCQVEVHFRKAKEREGDSEDRFKSCFLLPNGPALIYFQIRTEGLILLNNKYISAPSTKALTSVTRLGDLLDFGQLFKILWQQLVCPNLPHSQVIFVKVLKSLIFLVKSFLGTFYTHLATFYWSHCLCPKLN